MNGAGQLLHSEAAARGVLGDALQAQKSHRPRREQHRVHDERRRLQVADEVVDAGRLALRRRHRRRQPVDAHEERVVE